MDGDLTIAKTYGLQTELDSKALASDLSSKQNTIMNDDLSISQTYGLQSALDSKALESIAELKGRCRKKKLKKGGIKFQWMYSV